MSHYWAICVTARLPHVLASHNAAVSWMMSCRRLIPLYFCFLSTHIAYTYAHIELL